MTQHKRSRTQARVPAGPRNVVRRAVTDTTQTNPVHDVALTGEGSNLGDTEGQGQHLLVESFKFEFTKLFFLATVSINI